MNNLPSITETTNELPDLNKNQNELLWEENQYKIASAILEHIEKYGTMPAKTIIAEDAGLSRATVYKHIRTVAENPISHGQLDSFSILTEHVVAQVLRAAMRGDLQAAKLFLETSKTFNNPGAEQKGKQQNNFVQINKTIINQQVIQQLKPEQLIRLEQFITTELGTK